MKAWHLLLGFVVLFVGWQLATKNGFLVDKDGRGSNGHSPFRTTSRNSGINGGNPLPAFRRYAANKRRDSGRFSKSAAAINP